MKQFQILTVDFLYKNMNYCLSDGTFLNEFKKAVPYLTHKKLTKN